jgi:hypothetical protein
MPAYDGASFEPPAPLAYVTLRNPAAAAVVADVPLLIDSGADVTLIPAHVVSSLRLTALPGRRYELAGFAGGTVLAPVVRLDLLFCRRTFRGQFALIDQAWGILGRNVLNAVAILLDGPALAWSEAPSGRAPDSPQGTGR